MPDLNALFFRMITATPQNHLTQENSICDPKHTPAYSKNDRPPPKKPTFTYKTPSAISHKTSTHITAIVCTTPKHRICEQKTPPRRHKTKHVFYQNTATSSITYDFFHRNTLFSACITEKCNTEYSTEHKIQGEQTRIKRTDPYTVLIASSPFPMRPRKKNTRPLCRTDMPNRNNKITGFSGDTLQVFS